MNTSFIAKIIINTNDYIVINKNIFPFFLILLSKQNYRKMSSKSLSSNTRASFFKLSLALLYDVRRTFQIYNLGKCVRIDDCKYPYLNILLGENKTFLNLCQ